MMIYRTPDMKLCVHSYLPRSYANGPGCRAVIWLQGCPLRCPGCFNPQTHEIGKGQWVTVKELFCELSELTGEIEGITISGGEPLIQLPALTELLWLVKRNTDLSVVVFTGFTWAEVKRICHSTPDHNPRQAPKQPAPGDGSCGRLFLQCVDVLIAGPYKQHLRLANGVRGSSNKTVHFLTNRYGPEDLESVPCAEVAISSQGTVFVSGINPPGV